MGKFLKDALPFVQGIRILRGYYLNKKSDQLLKKVAPKSNFFRDVKSLLH